MKMSPISISLIVGGFILLFLQSTFLIKIRIFKKSKKALITYLKKVLANDYPVYWEESKCESWFNESDNFANLKMKRRVLIVSAIISLIAAQIFLFVFILIGVLKDAKVTSIPSGALWLPFIALSLFLSGALGIFLGGRHPDKSGTITEKLFYFVFFIFPKIKKSLIMFTHEPILSFYADPRIIESLHYLRYIKKVRKIELYCYLPDDLDTNLKSQIKSRMIDALKQRELSDIVHFLSQRIDHQHFTIGDNSIARIEMKHKPWRLLPEYAHKFPNDTYLLNPILAIVLKSFVNKIKGFDVGEEIH